MNKTVIAANSASLLAATPAMADRGFDRHDHRGPHWKERYHRTHFHRPVPPVHRTIVREEVRYVTVPVATPVPVYEPAPMPSGVTISFPNIFLPF
jgi:hypothetical protein